MQTKIDVRELSDRFAEVVSLALAGTEVILMDGDQPRARLVPLDPPRPRIAGLHAGAIQTASDFDAPISDDFWIGAPMKALLDTHAFIWWDSDPSQLSARAVAILQDPATIVLLSVVSIWEMLIKIQLGKMSLPMPLAQMVTQQQANGIGVLPITLEHALMLEGLPAIHKDPFDRLLICQANVEGAVLLSADRVMAQYPVQVIW